MPLVKQRDLLLIGNFALDVNAQIRHDKYFNNQPWASARDSAAPFLGLCKKVGAKTIAILAADAEFAQNLAGGVRAGLKEAGLDSVYDQNYPPNTVEFSSMVRAIRARNPDVVFVASYPSDSTAIIRSVNEIGIGNSVKLFGGGMVGLQYASIMESLGSALNGVVNYNTWAPEKTMDFPGIKDFLVRYQAKAKQANVDPLGFYLPPFDYCDRPDPDAGRDGHPEPGSQGAGEIYPRARDQDHRRHHPLRADRRMGEPAHRLRAVPGYRGQEPRPVP
jgi:branched-chain amino acid transport system substrate-binding protein